MKEDIFVWVNGHFLRLFPKEIIVRHRNGVCHIFTFIYSQRTKVVLSASYLVKFRSRKSVLWIIIKADGLIPCILFFLQLLMLYFGCGNCTSCYVETKSRVWQLVFPVNAELQTKSFQIFLIIYAPKRRQKARQKTVVCFGDVDSLLIFFFSLFFFFEWGTLVTRTQEDTLFPSFSVNNRLSLFIPLPSSVPPSPVFSFSPLSLWLCASQHQRESSDLWPQQPTLNLAKEGEHPVCSLAGPK